MTGSGAGSGPEAQVQRRRAMKSREVFIEKNSGYSPENTSVEAPPGMKYPTHS